MPIYEYKCLDCEAHIEKMQKFSDEPLKVCDKCGGSLEKQLSLSGFQFKGAGWYVTDYAGKKNNGSAAAEKSSSGESTAKSDSASNSSNDKTKSAAKESASKKD